MLDRRPEDAGDRFGDAISVALARLPGGPTHSPSGKWHADELLDLHPVGRAWPRPAGVERE